MTELSTNFTLEQMVRSQRAAAAGISNKPTPEIEKNLKELVTKLLQPIRDAIQKPIIVNSGYRNAATNRLVGGAKTSSHLSGYAADIVCPSYGSAKEFAKFIEKYLKENDVKFDQLIYEYGTWVHIGYKRSNGDQRGEIITINKNGTFQGIV